MAVEDIRPRIDAAIVATLKGLSLADPNAAPGDVANKIGEHVYGQLWTDSRDVVYPCLHMTHDGLAPFKDGGSARFAEWVFPNAILLADKSEDLNAKKDLYLYWLMTITDTFDGQRLPAVPEVIQCKIIPSVTFDPKLPEYQHVQSGLAIQVRAAVPRRRPVGV